MNLDSAFELVREFHVTFGHPVADRPALLAPVRVAARAEWMREEVNEFVAAPDIENQVDAMVDLIYFALGSLVEIGVRPEKIFQIVHEANMGKLWPDGSHRKRSDGKTIKPPSWRDPVSEIRAEITRQID